MRVSERGFDVVASLAQRGLSFILLPVYTRFLKPADYGVLELLTGLSAVLFGLLLLGLPSALTKVLHRDCETEAEKAAALPTAMALDAVPLLLGCRNSDRARRHRWCIAAAAPGTQRSAASFTSMTDRGHT